MKAIALVPPILALFHPAPVAAQQELLLSRTSGSQIAGQLVETRGTGDERALVFKADGEGDELVVPWNEILSLEGPAPRVTAPVAIYLVGGDEIKGEIVGGDEFGDTFLVRAPVMRLRDEPIEIPVDRLRTLIYRDRAPWATPTDFAISEDSEYDEAVFVKVRRGFDVNSGQLDRFDEEGIQFVDSGRSTPRQFRTERMSGITIRGGLPPDEPGSWLLVTTHGDRLRVDVKVVTPVAIQFESEFGELLLGCERIASLTLLGSDRSFLSDMSPERVEETGNPGGDGPTLLTFQKDRTVSGGVLNMARSPMDGYLVVDGRTYGKGLGVHSRCVLTYRVPEGMTRFHAKVGIDDEVRTLGVRGNVDIRVHSGEKDLFNREGMSRGGPAESLGVLEVEPGSLLPPEVGFGKGLFIGDRVDWLSAVFIK